MIRVGSARIASMRLDLPEGYQITSPKIIERIRADFESGKPFHYLFTGGVGRGKTFLATIMSHSIRYAMIRLGISPNSDEVFDNIIHENVRKIYQRYLAIMGGNSPEKALDVKRLTGWVNRPVVLIDDVGAETPGTESAHEWIGSLICDRYDAWKRGRAQGTIITTNLDYAQLHEIIELLEYDPDSGYYGSPEYLGSLPAMTTNYLIGSFNMTFFSNNAMPDMMLFVEGGELDEKTEKEIQAFLQNNVKGVLNSHKTIYIPVSEPNVKIRIEKLNDVKDGHFRFLRQDNRDEIISAHGVPPRLLGIVTAGSLGGGSEAEAEMKIFKETEIDPKQQKLSQFLNRFFLAEFGIDPGIKFKEFDITTALQDAQRHQIYTQAGVLTTDEIREELGKAPLDQQANQQATGKNLLTSLETIRKHYERHV